MKTKALLLAAAVMAVGVGTSSAQVYSANAVGYVNLSLNAGFTIIANPLNNTNNNVSTILSAAPVGTLVYRFDPLANAGAGGYATSSRALFGWTPDLTFNPGEGFFIKLAAPLNVTFVGEVPQGSLSNPLVGGNHYQLRASQVPQALPLGEPGAPAGTTLDFPAAVNDVVYLFNNTGNPMTSGYSQYSYSFLGGGTWLPGDNGGLGPTIPVGTGFFVRKAGPDVAWTRNFSVN